MIKKRVKSKVRSRDTDDEDDRRTSKNKSNKPKLKSSKGGSKFVYKKRSAETVRKQASRPVGRYDSAFKSGTDLFRMKNGDNTIRILPPTWPDADHYAYPVWMHRFIGPDNSTYACPRKMLNKPCPICDAAQQARDNDDKDEEKALRAQEMWCCWVIDRDGDDPELPQIHQMSGIMDKDILNNTIDKKRGDVLAIDDPDNGYDLTIRRSGQGIKTRYSGFTFDRQDSPISDDADTQEEILAHIADNPIPDLINYYDSKYLQNMLSGSAEESDEELDDDSEEDEDEDADDSKSKKTKKTKVKAKSRDEDEDEEDEESDEDSDDEGEEESDDEEASDEEDEESDDEEEESSDGEEEEDDETEDEDSESDEEPDDEADEDEEEEPRGRGGRGRVTKKPSRPKIKPRKSGRR